MGNQHVSVMINAPPETVFGLHTDPRRTRDRTELRLEMNYRVAGGPIGRLFDARVGDENKGRSHAASECGDAAPH
jgi:hypothetical protein